MAAPVMPKLVQGDDETNLDFGLRKAKAKRDHRAAMRRWREQGDTPAATPEAAAAEPEDEEHNITQYSGGRREAIEKAMKDAGE